MARKKTSKNDQPEDTLAADIDAIMATVGKNFGAEALTTLEGPHAAPKKDVPTVSTGSMQLDRQLGIGGLPRGRIVEVYGPEASGKTTLTLHAIADAQKQGLLCAFIDAEHALDPDYARTLGVQLDKLLLSQPDTGEQAMELADTLIKTGKVAVIVVDSVAALTPKSELEGSMTDNQPGTQARLMSKAMRKLTAAASAHNTLVIFINQIRMKIGVMFGSPETTSGGKALRFFASVRLDIRRIGSIKQGDKVLGNRTRVKVVKNKLAPPFRQVEFELLFGKGVDSAGELLDWGLENGFITRSGSWYSVDESLKAGTFRCQGRPLMRAHIDDNPEVRDALTQQFRRNVSS